MRQISTLLLAICLSIGLSGCDGEKATTNEGPKLIDPSGAEEPTGGSGKRSSGSDSKEAESDSE